MRTKTISLGGAFFLGAATCLFAGESRTTVIAGGWTYNATEAAGTYSNLSVSGKTASATMTTSTGGTLSFETTDYALATNKSVVSANSLAQQSAGWKEIGEAMRLEPGKFSVSGYNLFPGISAATGGATNTVKISNLSAGAKYRLAFWLSTTAGWGESYKTKISVATGSVTWDTLKYGYTSSRKQSWQSTSRLDEVVLGGENSDYLFAGIYTEFTYGDFTGNQELGELSLKFLNSSNAITPIHAISLEVIPEPSAFVTIAGLAALGFVGMRRKRK